MASIGDRVEKHRASLRASGLRPLQIWVPDTRRPGFAAECHRQSRLLRNLTEEIETQAWLEAAADMDDWE